MLGKSMASLLPAYFFGGFLIGSGTIEKSPMRKESLTFGVGSRKKKSKFHVKSAKENKKKEQTIDL